MELSDYFIMGMLFFLYIHEIIFCLYVDVLLHLYKLSQYVMQLKIDISNMCSVE